MHAHPVATSYSAALRDRAEAALTARGDNVDVLDLYGERFNPYLDADEWSPDTPGGEDRPDLRRYIDRLRRADHLVFVYPTWFGGPPAMFKGWLDRVLVPGVAFTLDPTTREVIAGLRHVRRLVGITTYGSSRLYVRILGDPGRRTIMRALRFLCARRCRRTWLALYGMDTATGDDRREFLDRVAKRMARL